MTSLIAVSMKCYWSASPRARFCSVQSVCFVAGALAGAMAGAMREIPTRDELKAQRAKVRKDINCSKSIKHCSTSGNAAISLLTNDNNV